MKNGALIAVFCLIGGIQESQEINTHEIIDEQCDDEEKEREQ